MTNNDALRGIRYLLNVSDAKIVEISALGGQTVSLEDVQAYLRAEEEPGYVACPHSVMARFLNGMVTFKRGPDDSRPPAPVETPVTNNQILKKLRVAFELKDVDLIRLIEKSGTLKITPTELSSFFRKPDHRNYRPCGDQYLRNVLKALSL